MMNDILKQIQAGEVSGMQFKERILDKYDLCVYLHSPINMCFLSHHREATL